MIIIEEHYKFLHENPELSGEEYKTNEYIKKQLNLYDVEYYEIDLSLIAFFNKDKSQTLAFRSEMDGLPIKEDIRNIIRSNNNNMHACGHDIHTATLLSLIEYINKTNFTHNISLIFQSKEENLGGSIDIVESDLFDKLNITKVFGIHVWPNLKYGNLFSAKNLMYGSYELDIIVTGKDNHVSNYNALTDATHASFLIYNELRKITKNSICHLGKITSGIARNICSKKAILNYTIRFKNNRDIAGRIRNKRYKTNCIIEYKFLSYYPPLKCNNSLLKLVDYNKIKTLKSAEDFGNYSKKSKVVFLLFGLGKGNNLHTSNFNTSECQRIKYKDKVKEILNIFKE